LSEDRDERPFGASCEELEKIKSAVGADSFAKGRYDDAREIFESVALRDDFQEFLTIPVYDKID